MTRFSKSLSCSLMLACLALSTGSAGAAPSEESDRLARIRPKAEQYTLKVPNSRIETGAARVHVKAPLETTKSTVTDYAHYSAMIETFDQAKVVGKQGNQTDVYLRVPILNGAARIWAVMRFEPPRKVGGDEYVVAGKMVKGNVDRFEATYRIRRIDDQNTQLNLEMLIVPNLPFPGSVVTAWVARASDRAVRRLRDGAEKTEAHKG
jgi:hypothetical protein